MKLTLFRKKHFWPSTIAGFVSGLFVMFLPYFAPPLGNAFSAYYDALFGPTSGVSVSLYSPSFHFLAFFIATLPLFLVFLLLPPVFKWIEKISVKWGFVIEMLLWFVVGVFAAYGLWVLTVGTAFTGSALVW